MAEYKKTVHIQYYQNLSHIRNSYTFEDISNNSFKEFVLDFRNVLSDHE